MSVQYGVALFTFEPEEETEIKITEGEKVIIYNDDIGEGWVEGENLAGQRGIFPRNYINITGNDDPSQSSNKDNNVTQHQSSWDNENTKIPGLSSAESSPEKNSSSLQPKYDDVDDLNDDWGSPTNVTSNSAQGSEMNRATSHNSNAAASNLQPGRPSSSNKSENLTVTETEEDKNTPINSFLSRYMNRFTYFSKSQAEEYILGILSCPALSVVDQEENHLQITNYEYDGPIWQKASYDNKFELVISDYQKSEAKGLLSSTHLYFLTSSQPNVDSDVDKVNRKYEHFQWLVQQLERKYPVCLVPVLPSKTQVDEAALTRQVKLLGIWAKQISNHPIGGGFGFRFGKFDFI